MFKKLASYLIVLTLMLFMVAPVFAADLNFSWLAPVEGDHVTGYKIFYGTESGTYPVFVDVGFPEIEDGRVSGAVPDVPEGIMHYFACVAYNEDEESDYSVEVPYRAPWGKPNPPLEFVTDVVININASNVKINIGDAVADN